MTGSSRRTLGVSQELDGRTLAAAVRTLCDLSWNDARRLVRTGKVQLGGARETQVDRVVRAGQTIEIVPNAPKPSTTERLDASVIAYADAHVVVVRKPPGISTVPYEEGERGTLDQRVASVLHRQSRRGGPTPSLGVVQRLDKETSGLLVMARTFSAKKVLAQQLRVHSMGRIYLALAHGDVRSQTFRSHLVKDRGDRLRGTGRPGDGGQLAVTHVEALERLAGATLVQCRLETGRTHQIRIHLAEAGHPLLGERVYLRDYGGPVLPAPRVMLHAAQLEFTHPVTGARKRFEEPIPEDFEQVLRALRR